MARSEYAGGLTRSWMGQRNLWVGAVRSCVPPKRVSSGGRLCLCSEWNGEQDGAAGGGHRMKRRETRELLPTPHLLCASPSHAPCPLSLTTVLLSRGYYAHISDVDTEAPRRKLASLESHGRKVEVQGSGPRTQAAYMEPGQCGQ